MDIEGLLRIGFPPKQLAKDFMDKLMRNSQDEGGLATEAAAVFVNGGLAILGVKTTITTQNVEDNQADYPADWRRYKFNPLAKKVLAYNEFLEHFFVLMRERQECDHESEAPVEIVMQLMCLWLRECERLLRTEANFGEQRKYPEAVAYINTNLLRPLHSTRVTYGHLFPMMDIICDRLLSSASEGMFYDRTHLLVVEATCKLMCGDDLVWFVECQKKSLDVFSKALTVENKPQTHKLIFNHLKLLLDQHSGTPEILRILTEFLTSHELLKIYYHNLLNLRKRTHLIRVLNLLNSLQNHLVSLDCFTQNFMAAFLEALLNKDCPELAAAVYINMMQKKGVGDIFLVQHIMDHFLNRELDMTKLPSYVHKISQSFPYLQHCLDEYFNCITANTDELASTFAARFLVTVHENMLKSITDNLDSIEHLLLRLPGVLATLQGKPALIVLLRVFDVVQFSVFKESSSRFNEIIENIESFALETFFQGKGMEYPLLHNLFSLLMRVVVQTGNRRGVKKGCEQVYSVYCGYEEVLKVYDKAGELPDNDFYDEYCTVLKKLCLLLTQGLFSMDQILDVLETLKGRFFDRSQITQMAQQANTFIDLYCIEVLTKCVICVSRQPNQLLLEPQNLVKRTVELLRSYLSQQLESGARLLKKPVVAVKTIYNSLINLFIAFPPDSHIIPLSLDSSTYQVLTSVLLALDLNARHVQNPPVSRESTQVTPRRSLEYKKQMFTEYINLHSTKCIELPSNVVWKVISQYGRPPKTFDAEVEKLIIALAVNHFEKYKQVMCLVIFTMQNACADVTFGRILKAHKTLIEKIMSTATEFKLHIVLNMLSMSGKKIDISAPTSTNRLLILKHLPILLNTSDLGNEEYRTLILNLAEKLWNHRLSAVEKKFLQTFIAHINKRNTR